MSTFLQYFKGSVFVTVLFAVLAYLIAGPVGCFTVMILGVLETSLSFDNAVVNAKKLETMNAKGRRWFLTWGMLIAVAGMRLVFPIAIVAIVASLSPVAVVAMAIHHPDQYAAALGSAHHQVAAFGGAFLLMIFLKFMLDHEKDSHWIAWLEAPLAKIGKLDMIQVAVTLTVLLLAAMGLPPVARMGFVEAGAIGVITYILVDGLGGLLEEYDEHHDTETRDMLKQTMRAALPGLIYLEVLDASMSFDGVIGAFALSDNIFIIMLGLGIGAMFVRSMTIMLVEKGTLAQFRYLEHGAFWAIGALATIMMVSVVYDVPEVVTGLIGAAAIATAVWSSVRANRRDGDASSEEEAGKAGQTEAARATIKVESDESKDRDLREKLGVNLTIQIPEDEIELHQLAQRMGVKSVAVIRRLFINGISATLTEVLPREMAMTVAEDMGYIVAPRQPARVGLGTAPSVASGKAGL